MDLTEFLNARLDEDEAAAKRAALFVSPWRAHIEPPLQQVRDAKGVPLASGADSALDHIARHDPTRVLREVTFMRAVLDGHAPHSVDTGPLAGKQACGDETDWNDTWYATEWPCATILNLASVWSDHQNYDPAWLVPTDSLAP